jgi:hypothetical protein
MKFTFVVISFFIVNSSFSQDCDLFLQPLIQRKYEEYKKINLSKESYFIRIVQHNNSSSCAFLFLDKQDRWKVYVADAVKGMTYEFIRRDKWEDSLRKYSGNGIFILDTFSRVINVDTNIIHPARLIVRYESEDSPKAKCWSITRSSQINNNTWMRTLFGFAYYYMSSFTYKKYSLNLRKVK